MLPAQNLRPESLLFVLATESRALNVVATSATIICFVFPCLLKKTKKINLPSTADFGARRTFVRLTPQIRRFSPKSAEPHRCGTISKPPLCKWEKICKQIGTACRDGGIVNVRLERKTIPQPPSASAPFTQGSLFYVHL